MTDYLAAILERKRREISRRAARATLWRGMAGPDAVAGIEAVERLRRVGALPRVIAEVKFQSPSAGVIRPRRPGDPVRIARGLVAAGAASVSVLADNAGFGGTPLDVRRVASEVAVPVLFKEFVLDPVQVALARAVGASMVLLLVRALPGSLLGELVAAVEEANMAPVVEAADEIELERALTTSARIVGVNARDLRTFRVDVERARRCLLGVPSERVAVQMSGVSTAAAVREAARGRADALLVGEALMRAPDPGARLRELLSVGDTAS